MTAVHALEVRAAALKAMKADAALAELVPAASIYPSTVPASRVFPFVRWDPPLATPLALSGLVSSRLRFAVSVFGKPVTNDAGAIVATAEDVVAAAASAIERVLDGATLKLACGLTARLVVVRTVVRQDRDEVDAWAASVGFDAEVAG